MASTWRHHGGVGNPAGARSRLLTVLVGDGVTIASEITSLAAAYEAMTPGHRCGTPARKPKSILDHMLWAQPWQTKQPIDTVAFPFVDFRRIRFGPHDKRTSRSVRHRRKRNTSRIQRLGNIEDPHVPIQTATGKPYKLALGRVWSYELNTQRLRGI